jgi:polyisoprenoid-binding protein YceI
MKSERRMRMSWKVDPDNSSVEFSVQHLKVTTVRGRFESFEGTLAMDENAPQASSVEGSVSVASVKTGISPRDGSLRSAGFFDVERFPKMSFRSTRIGPVEGDNFRVFGELTIRDVTRDVVFDVANKGELPASGGKRRWGFSASIALNRKDFGLKWNPLMELGSLLVADDVAGSLEIQFVEA